MSRVALGVSPDAFRADQAATAAQEAHEAYAR
jgi:hypothetical protein